MNAHSTEPSTSSLPIFIQNATIRAKETPCFSQTRLCLPLVGTSAVENAPRASFDITAGPLEYFDRTGSLRSTLSPSSAAPRHTNCRQICQIDFSGHYKGILSTDDHLAEFVEPRRISKIPNPRRHGKKRSGTQQSSAEFSVIRTNPLTYTTERFL